MDRSDNTYYDETGTQILVNDLLRVFHFRSRNRIHYMYHVAVMEETKDFPVMAMRCYSATKQHYRLHAIVDENRVYLGAKIISKYDWEAKRKKIKTTK